MISLSVLVVAVLGLFMGVIFPWWFWVLVASVLLWRCGLWLFALTVACLLPRRNTILFKS